MKNITYWLIAIFLGFTALQFKDDTYEHAKTILIVASFLLSLPIIYEKKLGYPLGFLIILYAWLFLSYFIASNKSLATTWVTNGTITLFTCFSVYALVQNKKFVPWAYLVFVIAIAMLARFAYNNVYLLSVDYTLGEGRLGNEELNTNTLAYFLFYLTFIIFILGDIIKNETLSKILKIAFFLIIPFSFFVAILTASRQVLVIQIPLVAVLLLIRYSINRKKSKSLYLIIILGIVAIIMAPKISNMYSNSYLAERNQSELVQDTRVGIMKQAIEIGNKNFFTGVGIGNLPARIVYIAHNSYLELYADNGIWGMLIYIFLTFGFVRKQYRRYKLTKDKNYLSFMTFGVFFIIDNFFYVFYTEYWLMSFYVLVVTHAEIYHRDKVLLEKT